MSSGTALPVSHAAYVYMNKLRVFAYAARGKEPRALAKLSHSNAVDGKIDGERRPDLALVLRFDPVLSCNDLPVDADLSANQKETIAFFSGIADIPAYHHIGSDYGREKKQNKGMCEKFFHRKVNV